MSGTLLKRYSKYDSTSVGISSMTTQADFNTWEYRYSPQGREQKRMLYSPLGDSSTDSHPNIYYQLGASGEMLAVFHGRQTAKDTINSNERRVYWYENQYLTNGGAVSIMSDSVRKYKITDYAGSTRAEIIYNSKLGITTGISTFDYKPYGDTLDASTNFLPIQSFAGEEKDVESSYMDMGYRTYDPLIGRFLQVDPLNESFPNITPYCYSYNSPMTWKDPSGLLPEDPLPGLNNVLSILKTLNDAQIEETWHRINLTRESNLRELEKLNSGLPAWSCIGSGRTGDSFISSIVNGIGNAISCIGKALGGLVSNLFGGGDEEFASSKGLGNVDSKYFINSDNYNNSNQANWKDVLLNQSIKETFNIGECDYGIVKFTTKVPLNYGLTNDGEYINKNGNILYALTVPVDEFISIIYISPKIANKYIQNLNCENQSEIFKMSEFISMVGHEIIHGFHINTFGIELANIWHEYSEGTAYKFSFETYFNSGNFQMANKTISIATQLGYYSNGFIFPSNFPIPILRK